MQGVKVLGNLRATVREQQDGRWMRLLSAPLRGCAVLGLCRLPLYLKGLGYEYTGVRTTAVQNRRVKIARHREKLDVCC